MGAIRHLLEKLRILTRRESFRSELDEEMAFHLAAAESAFVADGMTTDAAKAAARRQFGNTTLLQEQSHELISFRAETVAQDVRFALRQLRRRPGFAITAVLVLVLGIGTNLALFAFVDAALLKPLPYLDPGHLAAVYESCTLGPKFHLSYPDYLDWKRLNKVFQSLDVYEPEDSFILSTREGAQHADGTRVSAGFFRTLGVTPALGRDFRVGEDQPSAPATLLMSYATWQRLYGGRRSVLGETVTLNGTPRTIIGVLPKDFSFAPAGPAEFWLSLQPAGGCDRERGCHSLFGIGRLKDGVSLPTAGAAMQLIARQLELQYPAANRNEGAYLIHLRDAVIGDIRPILLVLLGGAALLLIVAGVNVGSLLLVRTESRKYEIAVRGALGASPARLLRQFLTEGLVLAGISNALGLVVASIAMRLLPKFIPTSVLVRMPYLQGLGIDGSVLVFAGGLLLVTTGVFTLTPMARLSFSELRDGLNEGGRSAAGRMWRRLGSGLVIGELAAALVLLSGAGLLCRSLYRLLHVDAGLQPDHLLSLWVEPPAKTYAKDAQRIALEQSVARQVSAIPGVKAMSVANRLALGDGDGTTTIEVEGQPRRGEDYEVNMRQVGAAYFTTLGARLLHGRYFAESEDETKPRITVINHALAARFFPGQDPIGKKIGFDVPEQQSAMIVGVVSDIKEGPLDMTVRPAFYVPFNQNPPGRFSVVVRTSQEERSVVPTLVAAMHAIDRGIAVDGATTMQERIHDAPSTYLHDVAAWIAGGFAAMALLLGVVGLYGVIAYSVSQRTREIGVRMALGAQRSTVYRLVLGQAWRLTLGGIVIGLAGSLATTVVLRPLLYGIAPWDMTTLLGVAALLGAAAMLASYLPAHRAASVNPVDALRAE